MTGVRIVHFNDHFFHRVPFGLARYSHELFRQTRTQKDLVVVPVGIWSNLEPDALARLRAQTGAIVLAGGRKLWASSWHFVGLPRIESVIGDFNVLHICGPGYRVPTRRPSVVTIHDIGLITHPHFFSPQYCWLFRGHMRDLLRRKARIIAVSRHTADEFRRAFGNQLQIDVVHEGVADVFLEPPDAQLVEQMRARIRSPFFLAAGSFNPRKNLLRVCRAFAGIADQIPHSLVLVGARGWDDEEVWRELELPALRGRVHALGFVDDRQLCALYGTADALIFASLFEGFGLPAVEAMGAGCPVIAANGTSLPEVVGDAGILVDPLDTSAIGRAMRRLAKEPALRADLSARSRERARRFSWANARDATCAVYRELAESA